MDDASDQDLDALIRRVDPDRWIASRFVADARLRADVIALYAFDHELARAPRVSSNPLVGEMRLVWWREALDEIFEGRPVRRHPTAEALAQAIRRRHLARGPLEALIDARYRELDAQPLSPDEAVAWARGTAGETAAIAAGMLDPAGDPQPARAAGAAWALARRASHEPQLRGVADEVLKEARRQIGALSPAAFPAAAHAALAGRATAPELAKRLHVTLAVARGRI